MSRPNTTGKETANTYNTDNGTGAVVRGALNDIIDALRTINSDTGDPTGNENVVTYQPHINTSTNELKIATAVTSGGVPTFTTIGNITQNNLGLLPLTGGTLTGPLSAAAGTKLLPSLHFGDSTSGLFRKGSNQIGLAFAEAETTVFDQHGITLQNQKSIRFSEPTSAATSNAVQYVEMKAPAALATNLTLTLPSTAPVAGYALISTDTSGSLSWGLAGGGAKGASTDEIFWENDQTVTTSYSISTGKNAGSLGPIEIQSGVTVTVGSGQTWTVV